MHLHLQKNTHTSKNIRHMARCPSFFFLAAVFHHLENYFLTLVLVPVLVDHHHAQVTLQDGAWLLRLHHDFVHRYIENVPGVDHHQEKVVVVDVVVACILDDGRRPLVEVAWVVVDTIHVAFHSADQIHRLADHRLRLAFVGLFYLCYCCRVLVEVMQSHLQIHDATQVIPVHVHYEGDDHVEEVVDSVGGNGDDHVVAEAVVACDHHNVVEDRDKPGEELESQLVVHHDPVVEEVVVHIAVRRQVRGDPGDADMGTGGGEVGNQEALEVQLLDCMDPVANLPEVVVDYLAFHPYFASFELVGLLQKQVSPSRVVEICVEW
mmetsp:Transcript_809/g.1173  ORF Transcript_809/g.1173 Transcript_809/m.1173 type:complete len:321 (-) Transcript_809:1243-2205(-)